MNQFVKSISTLLVCLSLGFVITGCETKEEKKAKKLAELLSVDGKDYKMVKGNTLVKGFAVLKDRNTGEFIAFNIDKYDKKTMKTADDYLSFIDPNLDRIGDLTKVVTSYQVWETHYRTEWVWVDGEYVSIRVPYDKLVTKYRTRYHGGGYIFQHNAQYSKDLEKMGALAQTNQIDQLSATLTENYGLSTDRAVEVARSLSGFSEIGKTRDLNDQDYNALFVELLGADRDEIMGAINEAGGNQSRRLDNLIEQAAQKNAVNPEQVRQMMDILKEI